MKPEQIFSFFWAWALSFCVGLGAVGAMATGLGLPVSLSALTLFCALAALIIAGCLSFQYGIWVPLALGAALCFRRSLWEQLRSVAAAVMERITLGYGIPAPAFLEGEPSESVLLALVMISGIVCLFYCRALLKRKGSLAAALAAILPLCTCVTVVDTVPHSLWLFLWGIGLVMLLITQTVRRQDETRGNRLAAILILPVTAMLLMLFWLIPREAPESWSVADLPGRILSHFTQGKQGSGSSQTVAPPRDTVDLSDLGELRLRQTPVMEVTADFSGIVYLRARDHDHYSGTEWNSTSGRTELLSMPQAAPLGTLRIRTRSPQGHYFLPSYQYIPRYLTGGYCPNPEQLQEYSLPCGSAPEPLSSDSGLTADELTDLRPYLQLPYETAIQVQTYLTELVTSELYGTQHPAEYVRQLVSELAPYDLNAPAMPPEETDLAVWFLEQGERGYCVHFASTAAVLLRALNVPARYVEGYMVYVEANKTVTVRESHAHAWVEYYLPELGWVILETTPADGLPETDSETTAPEETTAPTEAEVTTAPSETEPTAPTQNTDLAQKPHEQQRGSAFWWYGALVIGLVAVLWGQYCLRRQLFLRRKSSADTSRQGLVIYRQILRLSRYLGQPVLPQVTSLAQKARFSPCRLSAQELAVLQKQLRVLETDIREESFLRKIPAKWIFALY